MASVEQAPKDTYYSRPPPGAPRPHSDHIYKSSHGVDISLRIFPADVTSPSPWIFYTHGGAWLAGNHYTPSSWLVRGMRPRGFHVVSVGYRLAPQVALETIVGDCKDAFEWATVNLGKILEGKVDVERYITIGDSAGGHLSTMMGHVLTPPPQAVVNIYGVVDLTDECYKPTRPTGELVLGYTVEQLERAIKDHDPSHALTMCPWDEELGNVPLDVIRANLDLPNFQYLETHRLQMALKTYVGSLGGIIEMCLHVDANDEEAYKTAAREMSPLLLLDEKDTFPPTFMLHGTADDVVPVSQSTRMAEKLRSMGVEVEECYEEGEGHAWDYKYFGPQDDGYDKYILPVLDFMEKHGKA